MHLIFVERQKEGEILLRLDTVLGAQHCGPNQSASIRHRSRNEDRPGAREAREAAGARRARAAARQAADVPRTGCK